MEKELPLKNQPIHTNHLEILIPLLEKEYEIVRKKYRNSNIQNEKSSFCYRMCLIDDLMETFKKLLVTVKTTASTAEPKSRLN